MIPHRHTHMVINYTYKIYILLLHMYAVVSLVYKTSDSSSTILNFEISNISFFPIYLFNNKYSKHYKNGYINKNKTQFLPNKNLSIIKLLFLCIFFFTRLLNIRFSVSYRNGKHLALLIFVLPKIESNKRNEL